VNYCGIGDVEQPIHNSSEPNSWTPFLPILLFSTPDLPFFRIQILPSIREIIDFKNCFFSNFFKLRILSLESLLGEK
jgi:hypothetical protein